MKVDFRPTLTELVKEFADQWGRPAWQGFYGVHGPFKYKRTFSARPRKMQRRMKRGLSTVAPVNS